MNFLFRASVFLLCCAVQSSGINIQSTPVNSGGVIEVELESSVSLVCGFDGESDSHADEELVWLRNGVLVKLMEENKKGRSSVCVTPVIYEDNDATFTCYLGRNDTVKDSVTLNVTYPPQLSGTEEVTVEEEAELFLQCDIWANPPVTSVSWTLNGSIVDLSASGLTVYSDGFTSQLKASRVEPDLHEGTYKCTANSPKYGEQSQVFHITVTEKTLKFPLMPMIAGLVVVCLTALLAIVSRWSQITKCCK